MNVKVRNSRLQPHGFYLFAKVVQYIICMRYLNLKTIIWFDI